MLAPALAETALHIAEACVAFSLVFLAATLIVAVAHQRSVRRAANQRAAFVDHMARPDIRADLEDAERKPYRVIGGARGPRQVAR